MYLKAETVAHAHCIIATTEVANCVGQVIYVAHSKFPSLSKPRKVLIYSNVLKTECNLEQIGLIKLILECIYYCQGSRA